MSKSKNIEFKCPDCSMPISITAYESINTESMKDLPKKIITGEFFKVKCLGCGKEHTIAYSMLYNDLNHKTWIYLLLPSDKDYKNKISSIKTFTPPSGITSRLVHSPARFAEKVSILEAGRTDKIIEFCKMNIMAETLKRNPRTPIESLEILYVWDNPSEYFSIYSDNREIGYADFSEELYKAYEDFYSRCDNSDDNFLVCDINWAFDHCEELLQNASPSIVDNSISETDEANPEIKCDDEIGYCRKCGKRIPYDSDFCSYCGVPIVRISAEGTFPVSEHSKTNKKKKPKKERVKKPKQKKTYKKRAPISTLGRSLLVFGIVGVICIGIIYYLFNYVMPAQSSDSITTTTTTRKLVPIPVQNGSVIKSPSTPRLIDFEVTVPYDNNYYIYMEGKHSADTMSFYVKGGKTLVTQVPIGEYTIYFACGDIWYGTGYLFGDDTEYFKCDDTFEFTSEYGWTLSLASVYNGNLDTDAIGANEFPG